MTVPIYGMDSVSVLFLCGHRQSDLRMWARQPHPWGYFWLSMPASDGWLHCDLCLMVSGHDLSQAPMSGTHGKYLELSRLCRFCCSPILAFWTTQTLNTQILSLNEFLFLSFFPLITCQSHILVDCPSLQDSGLCLQARCSDPKHQPQLLDLCCFPVSLLGTWFLLGPCVMPAYMSTQLGCLL